MAGGAGEVGDVLLGKAVFKEHFVAHSPSAFIGGVFDKLDDARTGVFEDERFEAVFGLSQPAADSLQEIQAKGRVLFDQGAEVVTGQAVILDT